jgi:hypothetical protein
MEYRERLGLLLPQKFKLGKLAAPHALVELSAAKTRAPIERLEGAIHNYIRCLYVTANSAYT